MPRRSAACSGSSRSALAVTATQSVEELAAEDLPQPTWRHVADAIGPHLQPGHLIRQSAEDAAARGAGLVECCDECVCDRLTSSAQRKRLKQIHVFQYQFIS